MNKEKILAELKGRLGKTAVSDKTLDAYSNVVAAGIVEGKNLDDSFWAVYIDALKSMEGQINHDAAKAVETFKASLPKDEPTPEKKEDKPQDETMQQFLDLKASVDRLIAAQEAQKANREAETLKATLLGKSKELKIQETAIWEDIIAETDFSGGADVDSLLGKAKEKYEDRVARYRGEGVSPYGSSDDGASRVDDVALQARREAYLKASAKRLGIGEE